MNNNAQEQLREQLAELSPEQKQELRKELNKPVPQDYTVRRKRIYKGKVCPQGTVYLVVTVKTEKRKLEAYKVIPGNMGPEFEKGAADGLRELITKTYKV